MTGKLTTLIFLAFLASCDSRYEHATGTGAVSSSFASNGERIYFTGISASGNPIIAIGADGHMIRHMRMHGGGCATCHGAEREGGRIWPQFWIKAPALTAEALFASDHDDDGHGDHGVYDAESLRRAITEGEDPAGKQLDPNMPRWSMSRADLDDLIAYLQQSHSHE